MPLIKVKAKEIILHVLSEDGKGMQISERTLPRDKSEEVFTYFETHIANSLSNLHLRKARFKDLSKPVAVSCRDLLSARSDIVASSRALAEKLHGVVKDDERTARGDLVVCLFEVVQGEDVGCRLALLKIQPVPVFEHRTDTEDGKTYITLVKTGAMPSTAEELQKCAFVRPLDSRPEDFDMLLLDRQRKREKDVADFFAKGFLESDLVVDDRQATLNAHDILGNIENALRSEGLWEQAEPKVRKVMSGRQARLTETWVGTLGLSQGATEGVKKDLQKKEILDRPFSVDRKALKEMREVIRYEGDFELKLEVLAENFDQVVRSIELVRPEDGPPYHEILLHTTRFERT